MKMATRSQITNLKSQIISNLKSSQIISNPKSSQIPNLPAFPHSTSPLYNPVG